MRKLAPIVVFTALSFPAFAAEAPSEEDAPPAAPPRPLWTSFYIGFNRGFGGGVLDSDVGFVSAVPGLSTATTTTNRASGFIAGGQFGYTYSFANHFVLGLESDFQWSDMRSSHQATTFATNPALITNADIHSGIDWFGSTRARAGYSVGRLLPYVTGGVAYGQVQSSGVQFLGSGLATTGSRTNTRVGWAMGGGIEFALNSNLSAKAEYIYLYLPGVGGGATGVGAPPVTPMAGSFRTNSVDVHIVRSGLNYKFGGVGDFSNLTDGSLLATIFSEPSYDWTGFYVGINGGYGGGVVTGSTTFVQPGAPGLAETTTASNRTAGYVGGAQGGYNYQLTKNIVVGVETDAQWSDVKAQHQAATIGGPLGFVYTNTPNDVSWFGTTRLRAGYASGNALSYVTGGVAYGEVNAHGSQISGGVFGGSASQNKAGWALGGGAMYALTKNLSMRAEYLYVSFSGVSGPAYGVAPLPMPPLAGSFSTGTFGTNVFRFGFDWKVDGIISSAVAAAQ